VSAQDAGQITFVTDDEIARRLEQLENAARHLQVLIGTMARELAAIRGQLTKG
jgi:hypothetical protein